MTTPATGSLAIDARGLRKEFGERTAVRDLTLSVRRGEIFGFLGPNGAGKSTSIKMFLGLVHPTAGDATLLGAPIGDVGIRQRVGFLPEDFRFYDWLTPSELLQLHGQLSGMAPRRARMRVPEALELVGMTAHASRRLRGFSKGMLQRLGLAQALIHEPDLIFLDEPTSGLDPMGRRMVRDVIRAQRDRGATVFLNSHLLSEIEVTCDRVAFIKDGTVVESRDLRRDGATATRQVRITATNVTPAIITRLTEWSSRAELEGNELVVDVASDEVIPIIVRHLVTAGADVSQVVTASTSLEEIFVRLVGEDRGL